MSVDLQSSPGDSTTTRASSSDGRSFLVRASAGAAIRPGEYVRIIRQDGADVLGITGFAHGGGPRNVGEDHGHDDHAHAGQVDVDDAGDTGPSTPKK